MKKGIIIGSVIAGLAATLVGGAALLHGARAEAGWHGGPRGWEGPGMEMGMGGGPRFGRGGHGMAMLEQFDRSGDGQFSQEDVDAVRGERFATFDTEGDGVLGLDEYEQLWLEAMRPRMVRSFQQLDADGDATITTDEFQEPFANLVAQLDRDDDGLIDAQEMHDAARGRHAAKRGGRDSRHRSQEDAPDQSAD